MRTPNKLPWKWVSVTGGWDGIADADGHVLFKMAENNPINADFAVRCVNSHAQLVEALRELVQMNAATWGGIIDYAAVWDRAKAALKAAEEEAP